MLVPIVLNLSPTSAVRETSETECRSILNTVIPVSPRELQPQFLIQTTLTLARGGLIGVLLTG